MTNNNNAINSYRFYCVLRRDLYTRLGDLKDKLFLAIVERDEAKSCMHYLAFCLAEVQVEKYIALCSDLSIRIESINNHNYIEY